MTAPAQQGPALLDGAMGTALLARGLPPGALPDEWVLERPGEVAAVHASHAAAGAAILLTCTFGATTPRLEARLGRERVDALLARAPALARAAGAVVRVAGDLGPTGLSHPGGPPPDTAALRARYARAAEALTRAGVDLLWIESQWDLPEALAALAAARSTGLPAALTFTFAARADGFALPDGTAAAEALLAAAAAGAAAVGTNCVAPGPALDALAAWASRSLPVPFAAKPSPGLPGAVLPPEAFAAALTPTLEAGTRLVGGCCGATADHLRALAAALPRGAAHD
jgi:5-methyltetrahydrofolate--homocysteine methyltransferase